MYTLVFKEVVALFQLDVIKMWVYDYCRYWYYICLRQLKLVFPAKTESQTFHTHANHFSNALWKDHFCSMKRVECSNYIKTYSKDNKPNQIKFWTIWTQDQKLNRESEDFSGASIESCSSSYLGWWSQSGFINNFVWKESTKISEQGPSLDGPLWDCTSQSFLLLFSIKIIYRLLNSRYELKFGFFFLSFLESETEIFINTMKRG